MIDERIAEKAESLAEALLSWSEKAHASSNQQPAYPSTGLRDLLLAGLRTRGSGQTIARAPMQNDVLATLFYLLTKVLEIGASESEDLRDLSRRSKSLTEAMESLVDEQILDASGKLSGIEEKTEELKILKGRVKEQDCALQKLMTENELLSAKNNESEAKILELEECLRQLKDSLEQMADQKKGLRKEKEKIERDISNLEGFFRSVEQKREELTDLKAEAQKQEGTFRHLEGEYDRLSLKKEENQTRITELSEKIRKMRDDLKKIAEEEKNLKIVQATLRNRRSELLRKKEVLEKERTETDNLDAEVKELEDRQRDLREKVSENKLKIAQTKQIIEEYLRENQSYLDPKTEERLTKFWKALPKDLMDQLLEKRTIKIRKGNEHADQ